jgi:Single-strand binding protein family
MSHSFTPSMLSFAVGGRAFGWTLRMIPAGENLVDAIFGHGLSKCHIVPVVLSVNGINAPRVKEEYNVGRRPAHRGNRQARSGRRLDYDVVAWDKRAETSNTYLKKGTRDLVEGRLAIRSHESKSGEKHKARRGRHVVDADAQSATSACLPRPRRRAGA